MSVCGDWLHKVQNTRVFVGTGCSKAVALLRFQIRYVFVATGFVTSPHKHTCISNLI